MKAPLLILYLTIVNYGQSIAMYGLKYLHFSSYKLRRCETSLKANSHCCIFRVRLWETVAFLPGDRKFPISALMQPTAENADLCV